MALKLEGGLLSVTKALISRPDQDPAAPVWLSNLGKVNNVLVLTFPSFKRKGMLFPCCRGTLEIKLLSDTDGEYGTHTCGSGSQCCIFLSARGPEDPPEYYPCFQAIAAGLSTPPRAHLVSSCFGKCPRLSSCCVGLLAEEETSACSSHPCRMVSEPAQPGSVGVFDNLCRVKMVVSEQQCRVASVLYYLQMLMP